MINDRMYGYVFEVEYERLLQKYHPQLINNKQY